MDPSGLQYLSDEHGDLTGVVVPIDVWREIRAELETHHLLKSETMRRRLQEATVRSGGLALDEVVDRLGIDHTEVP